MLTLAIVAGSVLIGGTADAQRLPGLFGTVRPGSIQLAPDGTVQFAGANGRGTKVRWTRWSQRVAVAAVTCMRSAAFPVVPGANGPVIPAKCAPTASAATASLGLGLPTQKMGRRLRAPVGYLTTVRWVEAGPSPPPGFDPIGMRNTRPIRRRAAVLIGLCALSTTLVFGGLIGSRAAAVPNVAKCIPAAQLRHGTRRGVIRVASRPVPDFQLRVAERAQPRDFNYQLLAATCSKAMIRRTWYTDLHPLGMPCQACDSHEYWVLRRHGGWASLGYFAG